MRSQFTVTEGARYLGVSASKLSRHLPPERARKGSPAGLTVDELVRAGTEMGVDPQLARARIHAALGIDPALPDHIRAWAERAFLEDRSIDLEVYNARIPEDLLERPGQEMAEDFTPQEPWDASVLRLDAQQMARWLNEEE